MVTVKGFQHSTFTDLPLFNLNWVQDYSKETGYRQIAIQREYTLEFFNKHLKHTKSNNFELLSEGFPEVKVWSKGN